VLERTPTSQLHRLGLKFKFSIAQLYENSIFNIILLVSSSSICEARTGCINTSQGLGRINAKEARKEIHKAPDSEQVSVRFYFLLIFILPSLNPPHPSSYLNSSSETDLREWTLVAFFLPGVSAHQRDGLSAHLGTESSGMKPEGPALRSPGHHLEFPQARVELFLVLSSESDPDPPHCSTHCVSEPRGHCREASLNPI
jgi:hypothetical protein